MGAFENGKYFHILDVIFSCKLQPVEVNYHARYIKYINLNIGVLSMTIDTDLLSSLIRFDSDF